MRTVIRKELLLNTKGAALALFVLFSLSFQANAFQGKMEKVSLAQCGAKACVSLTAAEAEVSWFSSNMNLQKAKLSVRQLRGKSEIYNVNEVYVDHVGQRIYLHGVAELKNAEAFYDLRSEQLTVFSN